MTPQKIIQIVADEFGVTYMDIISSTRKEPIATARRVSRYLIRNRLHMKHRAVIEAVGLTNHASSVHAVESVEEQMAISDTFQNRVLSCEIQVALEQTNEHERLIEQYTVAVKRAKELF